MRLNELEIKIQLDSKVHFEQVYGKCQKLCGQPESHVRQLDEYYDTADTQLKELDMVVRIRSTNNSETIALKSPRRHLSGGMTSRVELEFKTAPGETPREQLARQGLSVSQASEKERWTFVKGEIEIVLDHLPFLGYFVEIEGPSQDAINEVVRLLDLPPDAGIQKNYGELTTEKFSILGLSTTNICSTFAEEMRLGDRAK
jgi:predicted adenylyl cyclase CyaB